MGCLLYIRNGVDVFFIHALFYSFGSVYRQQRNNRFTLFDATMNEKGMWGDARNNAFCYF